VRWLHSPLLHFVLGGALLFLATGSSGDAGEAAAEPVVVTAADVAQLRGAYAVESGLDPTPADEAALVEDAIAEELLFREAVARGLDRNDRSVRSWLVEQVRVLSDDPDASDDALYARALELGLDRHDLVVRRILVHKIRLLASHVDQRAASEDELRAWYERNADAFRLPARLSLWHVFVDSAQHRTRAAAAAHGEHLLAKLREQRTPPREAVRGGDSFPLPSHLLAQSPPQLEKVFGARFAAEVSTIPEGAWSGPVASPYGVHLVWIERRAPGAPADFADVRGRVLEGWREERRKERLANLLHELRARYPLQVESAAWAEHGRGNG